MINNPEQAKKSLVQSLPLENLIEMCCALEEADICGGITCAKCEIELRITEIKNARQTQDDS
jgi:hypothetical protein